MKNENKQKRTMFLKRVIDWTTRNAEAHFFWFAFRLLLLCCSCWAKLLLPDIIAVVVAVSSDSPRVSEGRPPFDDEVGFEDEEVPLAAAVLMASIGDEDCWWCWLLLVMVESSSNEDWTSRLSSKITGVVRILRIASITADLVGLVALGKIRNVLVLVEKAAVNKSCLK